MTASLLLNTLELVGTSTNPEYRLGRGLDLGAPEPDQTAIASLLLDGDSVAGKRTRNRTINLTVCVNAPGLTGASALTAQTAATDALMTVLAQDTFTLQWTPSGGLPIVFDCFRARAERQRSIIIDGQGWTTVTFSCQAKPFGRSTVAQTPSTTTVTTTTHGKLFTLPTLVGSARTPVNLALTTGGSFLQFLLHSPPSDQDSAAQILTALNSSLTDQTVTIAAANAKHRGTFSIVLGGNGTDGLDATVEITVTQKENGTAIGTIWDEAHAFPGVGTFGRLFAFSEITLPLFDTPDDNTQTSYDIRVHITSGGNRYSELMLLDTRGQTIYTDGISLPGTVLYVDEPRPLQSGPGVFVSASNRLAAFSKLIECVLSGGPILLEPGANKLLAWTDAGTPAVAVSYYPRWLDERTA